MAKKHRFTMPNGTYPIDRCTGEDSVKSAADLAHNSKTYSFEQIRGYVMRVSKILGCPKGTLPDTWGEKP